MLRGQEADGASRRHPGEEAKSLGAGKARGSAEPERYRVASLGPPYS